MAGTAPKKKARKALRFDVQPAPVRDFVLFAYGDREFFTYSSISPVKAMDILEEIETNPAKATVKLFKELLGEEAYVEFIALNLPHEQFEQLVSFTMEHLMGEEIEDVNPEGKD